MTDEELDALIIASATITDTQLVGLGLAAPAAQLCEEIMSQPQALSQPKTPAQPVDDQRQPAPRPPRRLRPSRILVAAAVAVVIAAAGLMSLPAGNTTKPAWAAPLIQMAESSPQLLLTGNGWLVSRADQYGDREGEMTFVNGDREMDLYWRSGSHQGWVTDRADSAESTDTGAVLGAPAQIFRYEGTDQYTALWVEGDRTLEFRGDADSLADFVAVLTRLERVDVDQWLSALPEHVIAGAHQGPVIQDMLADIPTPEHLAIEELGRFDGISDRYQLGARVTGPVACAWLSQWVTAIAEGDTEAAATATRAMATSHDWAILNEMADEGDWPRVIWEIADGMAGDGTFRGWAIAEEFGTALGCEG